MIKLKDGIITHQDDTGAESAAWLIIRRDTIRVGCTDIEPAAAEFILKKWRDRFGNDEIVLQVGVPTESK